MTPNTIITDKNLVSLAKLKAVCKKMFRELLGYTKSIKKVFGHFGDLRKRETWVLIFDALIENEASSKEIQARPFHEAKYAKLEVSRKHQTQIVLGREDFLGNYCIEVSYKHLDKYFKLGRLVYHTMHKKWCMSPGNTYFSNAEHCIENALLKATRQSERYALGIA